MKYGIGKKEMRKCFDGKMHECTILDCSIILKGKTYEHKAIIKNDGFRWWPDEKFWHKHLTTEEEIEAAVSKYRALGLYVTVTPNFRITDDTENPIDYRDTFDS